MKVLVTGANGFIGSAVLEALLADGHEVVACGRHRANLPSSERVVFRQVDAREYLQADDWLELLDGVQAVVNCLGILKGSKADFDRLHHLAPLALARACRRKGVERFVQLSALGHPDDGEFIASKHRFDEALAAEGLESLVVRPSVVLSLRGSYGGTSMLRALAALPAVRVLPGDGNQRIQPILLEDLARVLVSGVTREHASHRVVEAVGPEVITLREYLCLVRAWLKFPKPWFEWRIPAGCVAFFGWLAERFVPGPMGITLWRMLERGNVAKPDAHEHLVTTTAYEPRQVSNALTQAASFVQDRWHARLYFLAPLVWLSLVGIWLVSGLAGFVATPESYGPILSNMGVPATQHASLVLLASAWNLLLGAMLLFRVWLTWVLRLMLLSVVGYTLALSIFLPEAWLEPTGGLLKNLAILVLLPIFAILEGKR